MCVWYLNQTKAKEQDSGERGDEGAGLVELSASNLIHISTMNDSLRGALVIYTIMKGTYY